MRKEVKVVRYSEPFKHQVLNEIEQGELSIAEARLKYGIKGKMTIQKWARKYGSFGVLPKIVRVEKPGEVNRIKVLEAENRKLKEALADSVLDRKVAESTLEVICEQRGWDLEEVKKKAGMGSPARQLKKKKR